jgi:hypothetical protein
MERATLEINDVPMKSAQLSSPSARRGSKVEKASKLGVVLGGSLDEPYDTSRIRRLDFGARDSRRRGERSWIGRDPTPSKALLQGASQDGMHLADGGCREWLTFLSPLISQCCVLSDQVANVRVLGTVSTARDLSDESSEGLFSFRLPHRRVRVKYLGRFVIGSTPT